MTRMTGQRCDYTDPERCGVCGWQSDSNGDHVVARVNGKITRGHDFTPAHLPVVCGVGQQLHHTGGHPIERIWWMKVTRHTVLDDFG